MHGKMNVFMIAFVAASFSFISITYASMFSKNRVGTTGAQFLKIGCGARAIGMGEAYTAVADEASAIYWNPAGLYQIQSRQISAMHTVWFESINYDFLAYAQPLMGGVMGVSANYLYMNKISKLDEYGTEYGDGFSPYDLAINAAYSSQLKGIIWGVNFKFIQQSIDDVTANGHAVDLGVLYRFPDKKLKSGFSIQNIGTPIRFINESDPLPLTVRLGISYKLKDNLILALDGVAPIDNIPNLHFGAEYQLTKLPVTCRLGYKTTTISDLDALSGLSGGLGFNIGLFNLDYAWVPYGELGYTHRVSLGMKFGK